MKNKKHSFLFTLSIIALAFISLTIVPSQTTYAKSNLFSVKADKPEFQRDIITIKKQNGTEVTFDVELAREPAQQTYGLMYRTNLPKDEGMIFLFEKEAPRTFWMKNTLIPLDIIFISKDGTINHIHHSAKPQDETRITSNRPAMAVLEIGGGISEQLGISEGDIVIYKDFRNTMLAE